MHIMKFMSSRGYFVSFCSDYQTSSSQALFHMRSLCRAIWSPLPLGIKLCRKSMYMFHYTIFVINYSSFSKLHYLFYLFCLLCSSNMITNMWIAFVFHLLLSQKNKREFFLFLLLEVLAMMITGGVTLASMFVIELAFSSLSWYVKLENTFR